MQPTTTRATRFAVSLEEVSPSYGEVTAPLHRRKSPRIT